MSIFLTLFINGLAEAALLFLLAAGLTIILGMMGVLNFAHGTLFLWGGYVHVWLFALTGDFLLSLAGATAAGFLLGLCFERLFISGFYGRPTAQILITLGLMIVFTELARLLWGPDAIVAVRPAALSGTLTFQGAIISRYRLFLILVGAAFAALLHLLMQKSRIGMVIRAGVQSAEMVQALGINIRSYFSFVFAAGAAMAALGGALYAPMVGGVWSGMGIANQILAFIVVVIGGLGSFGGSAAGSVLLGLGGAAIAWFFPPGVVVGHVLLMAAVLSFRPAGLFGLAVRR